MRARKLSLSVLTVSAAALILAAPAYAFDDKAAAPATGQNNLPQTAPDEVFEKATSQQIETELRADPLTQAAFFARQFSHDPTNAKLGLYLSNAQRALGKYPEAADTAHTVLLFAPNNIDVLLAASRAHIEGNNAFYAIDLLKRVNQLKPDNWEAWSLLGVAYDQTKRPDDAQAAWQMALKVSPDNPAVLANMAMARLTAGDIAGAEPLLRTAVAQKTATIRERQDLALVLGLENKMPEAEKLLRDDLPPQAADADLAWLQQAVAARAHPAAAATPVAASPAAATVPVATSPARTWANLQATGS